MQIETIKRATAQPPQAGNKSAFITRANWQTAQSLTARAHAANLSFSSLAKDRSSKDGNKAFWA
jgi:hypothetical protein